jgi:hypothetical protein
MENIQILNIVLLIINLSLWFPIWITDRKESKFVNYFGGFTIFIWAPLTLISLIFNL